MTVKPDSVQWDIDEVVDTRRYPLDRAGSPAYLDCVARVRESLAADSCAVLDRFIRADRIDRMVAEAKTLSPRAVYREQEHNPYFSEIREDLPAGDPRGFRCRRTNGMVPAELFDRDGDLWRLYTDESLHRFLADCLEIDRLYCYEDPFGSMVLSVQPESTEFPWHFDTGEFAVTLLLQSAEGGGKFEYVPEVRRPGDECYPDVARVLEGDSKSVRVLEPRVGGLQLFRGRYSLHRVTAVEGRVSRIIAVLTYALSPGVYATPERSRQAWGRAHPDQVAAHRACERSDSLMD